MVVYTVNKKLIAFYNFLWYNFPPVTIETKEKGRIYIQLSSSLVTPV